MPSLEEALTQISEMKGHLLAHDAFIEALLRGLPADALAPLAESLRRSAQAMQSQLLPKPVAESTVMGFERAVQSLNARMRSLRGGG